MSYILEALKKAQAERQLGSAPTIHAPQAAALPEAAAAGRPKVLLLGLAGGALAVAAGALLLWRSAQPEKRPAAAPASVSVPASAAVPAAVAPPVPVPVAPAPADALVVSAPPERPVPERRPEPRPSAPAPAGPRSAGPRSAADAKPVKPAEPAAAAIAKKETAPAPVAQPVVPPQAQPQPQPQPPAPEDSLPLLQQLPPALQQQVPRVAFGGYMYSSNPADRLLLVDKTLRHEGEEVAPGLVLEKLLPKAAVMNFRGVRYRVAY